jgi:hypothetical protein
MDIPIHEGKGVGPRVLAKVSHAGLQAVKVTQWGGARSVKRKFVSLNVDGPFLPWPFFYVILLTKKNGLRVYALPYLLLRD